MAGPGRPGRGVLLAITAVLIVTTGVVVQHTADNRPERISSAEPGGQDAGLPGAEPERRNTGNPVYFVHGYAPEGAVDCEAYWGRAQREFRERGWRGPLRTVGFYAGDTDCDVTVGEDMQVSTDTSITRIAATFAQFLHRTHTRAGEPVDLVAHSMGGIITRVALLGSARGWAGYPNGKLRVGAVTTLGTPHGGLSCDLRPEFCVHDQLRQQAPGSELVDVLHSSPNRLDRAWAGDTEWHVIGSEDDALIDTGSAVHEGFPVDARYRYLRGGDVALTHTAVHAARAGAYRVLVERPGRGAQLHEAAPPPLAMAFRAAASTRAPPDAWSAHVALRDPLGAREGAATPDPVSAAPPGAPRGRMRTPP
ncbi:esterase/lipase family protein [Salinifilum aidingensis]